jgi:hypothetical protein
MGRGGARPNAGVKPTWKNGKTKTIRVPIVLADEILKIARDLDKKGVTEYDTGSNLVDLSDISVPQLNGKKFVFLQDLIKLGYLIRPLSLANRVNEEIHKGQIVIEPKKRGYIKAKF